MSKKRKFTEYSSEDAAHYRTYENLADEDEQVRLEAAHRLVSRCVTGGLSVDDIKSTLTRLIRGLCSSRKAARLGFSVALTGLISELSHEGVGQEVSSSYLIDLLESQTVPESNTSGQDERDHYLGRVFGAGAIISSGCLFATHDTSDWQRLLDLICAIAIKKPWLRQECGFILLNFVQAHQSHPDHESLAVLILERLNAHRLIRTPEGLAVWIITREKFPHAALPKNLWKHGDPFAKKDVSLLADVLKDARAQSSSEESQFESQGSAMWSAQLHFVWDLVLSELYKLSAQTTPTQEKKINFETFWTKAIDESLFSPNSSVERKQWGLLVLSKIFSDKLNPAPHSVWKSIFTSISVQSLMKALRGEDRYLQRTSKKAVQALQDRLRQEPHLRAVTLKGILEGSQFIDFDGATKTKVFETILSSDDQSGEVIEEMLSNYILHPGTNEPAEAHRRRKVVVNLQNRMFESYVSHMDDQKLTGGEKSKSKSKSSPAVASKILKTWVRNLYFHSDSTNGNGSIPGLTSSPTSNITEETRSYIRERLAASFEFGLKHGSSGTALLQEAILCIRKLETRSPSKVVQFDKAVQDTVDRAWNRLQQASVTSGKKNTAPDGMASDNGLSMLYCLTLFQVYNGETEAVEILEDLLSHDERLDRKANGGRGGVRGTSDSLIEILLSFASKPSKFQRRLTLQVFETLAAQITSEGLESLTRILAAKESAQGQQEMFEVADVDEGDEESDVSDSDLDSDVEMIGSDVESVSEDDGSGENSDDDDDDNSSSSESGDDNEDDDAELAEFEAKLAKALGTRRGEEDLQAEDTSGDSDSDMDDDEMMELDLKLAEVFRTRQQAPNKKKEQRDAKETIVQFKNRVLDFVEIYLKHQHLNPHSLELILPLLKLARETNTKQLADRACSMVRDYCGRCKGQNVPVLASKDEDEAEAALAAATEVLEAVHVEAGLDGSNARAAACSAASILLVKTLLHAGVALRQLIAIYGDTLERQLTDKTCRVQPAFFTEWNNWCAQARGRLAR